MRNTLVRIPFRIFLLTFLLVGTDSEFVLAQSGKGTSSAQLGVDVVSLKSGKSLRGVIIRQEPNGSLLMAIPRDWLMVANPDLLERLVAEEAILQQTSWEQLRDRLKKRLENPSKVNAMAFFLEKELERVEQRLNKLGKAEAIVDEPRQFVWNEIKRDAIAKIVPATPDRQRIAQWGWSERLKDVAVRDVSDLAKELKKAGIDPAVNPPELWDQLAARPQNDHEWDARMAIVDYGFGTPIDFQGTGDVLVRSSGTRDLTDMAPVITKVLRGQVDSFLKELTGEGASIGTGAGNEKNNDWLKSAVRETDRLNASSFRATRVELKVEGRQSAVQTVFVARIGSTEGAPWETIWMHRESADAMKARPQDEAQISNDPQVKQALAAIKSFGLGAEDQIDQAIRFGAATMSAQKAADSRFFAFRDRYLKHLDGPPLWWAK